MHKNYGTYYSVTKLIIIALNAIQAYVASFDLIGRMYPVGSK